MKIRLSIFTFSIMIALFGLPWLPAIAMPAIQHWTTENDARVYFVPAHELPMVDVRIVFDAGSARDSTLPGLAQLTNLLLDSGTAELSADAVAKRLDGVGAQLDSGALRDMAWLSLRSLSDPQYLTPAVDTVARLLRKPAFAKESLERERNRMIAGLQELAQSPDAIAERNFYEALYGKHPYASPPEGTEESLSAITRQDVQTFYDRYYVAANAVIAITGDLNSAAARQLAHQLIGALPAGEGAPTLPQIDSGGKARVIRFTHPSSQSHIDIGQVGIKRGDPDYYSLYLGNHVLGGNGLVSKLAEEIREKRGLSYGVYSYFSPMNQAGPFLIGLQTRNDQTDEAIEIAKSTLQHFMANGPDPEDLEMARQNIIDGFPLRIDNNSEIVQYLAMIGFYNLPLDYLDTFPSKIKAISRNQILAAFQRHLHPDRLITVVVGGK